jgi:hypothetical protein
MQYFTLFRPQSQSSPISTIPLPQIGNLDRRPIVLTNMETNNGNYMY